MVVADDESVFGGGLGFGFEFAALLDELYEVIFSLCGDELLEHAE